MRKYETLYRNRLRRVQLSTFNPAAHKILDVVIIAFTEKEIIIPNTNHGYRDIRQVNTQNKKYQSKLEIIKNVFHFLFCFNVF